MLQAVRFRSTPEARQHITIRRVQIYAQWLLQTLGIRIITNLQKERISIKGSLLVSNHQSYLDILVIAAHFPVRFVAKQEVRDWPVIGLMTKLAGTIFIDRRSLRNGTHCVREIADALRAGMSVHVFPEGTSTDGSHVLPFKPLLFSGATRAGAPVLPATIRYLAINQQPLEPQSRDQCCWYGEMNFLTHFWQLLAVPSMQISVEFHSLMKTSAQTNSREVALQAQQQITENFEITDCTITKKPCPVSIETESTGSDFAIGGLLYALLTHGQDYLAQVPGEGETIHGKTR